MDTTKKYIEMSKALPDEMLDSWEPTEGDYFAEVHRNQHTDIDVYYNCPEEDTLAYVKNPIWLRRQDQLQDMIDGDYWELHYVMYHFMQSPYIGVINAADLSNSMEQLWLMLFMDEKYGLKWNSEQKEWIKC